MTVTTNAWLKTLSDIAHILAHAERRPDHAECLDAQRLHDGAQRERTAGGRSHGLRASIAGLDQGEFTEGHQLDGKWRVRKAMIGRRLSQEGAKRLLANTGPLSG